MHLGKRVCVKVLSSSGIRELDQSFVRSWRERSYLPALMDGLPIASWLRTNGSRMQP